MWSRKAKPKVRVLGAMMVTMLFLLPVASALTYTKYPPYGVGYTSWTPQGLGNYEVYKHNLGADPSTGVIEFHLGGDTGPPGGALRVTALAQFTGTAFTVGQTNTYTITYTFQIVSGNAQLYTMVGAAVQILIQFRANLQDLTTLTWVLHDDATTTAYAGYICCGGGFFQDLSGRYFSVVFSGLLTAQHSYGLLGYEYADLEVNWPNPNVWGDVETDMSAQLLSVQAYTASGGGGCVLEGTLIRTPSGSVSVQNLRPGDAVSAYDLNAGKFIPASVQSVNATTVANIVNINNGTLLLTPYDQPIYIRRAGRVSWLKNPGELVAGDYVFNAVSGTWVFVNFVVQTSGSYRVYDVGTSGPNYIANNIVIDRKGHP